VTCLRVSLNTTYLFIGLAWIHMSMDWKIGPMSNSGLEASVQTQGGHFEQLI